MNLFEIFKKKTEVTTSNTLFSAASNTPLFTSETIKKEAVINENYRVIFMLPSPNILYIRAEGNVAYADFEKQFEQRNAFLEETGGLHRTIIELRDYSAYEGRITKNQRMQFRNLFVQHESHIRAVIISGASPFLEAAFHMSYLMKVVNSPMIIIHDRIKAWNRALELDGSPTVTVNDFRGRSIQDTSTIKRRDPIRDKVNKALEIISTFTWDEDYTLSDNALVDEENEAFRDLFEALLLIKEDVHRLLNDQRISNEQLEQRVAQRTAELNTANKELERLNLLKSNFISTVSHELRTPLTSVMGFTKIIGKKLDEVIFPILEDKDAKVLRTIEQIQSNIAIVTSESERLTSLINDVLDIAKMEAGKTSWNIELISPQLLVERANAVCSSLSLQKGLELYLNIEADLPKISVDSNKIHQVLINLLSNAIKFTEKGSVTCSVKKIGTNIQFSIIDTGIGIAKNDIQSVFEKFHQIGDTLTDKPQGTGLGLPICKEIIGHFGGIIWGESIVGSGSSFHFTIPCIENFSEKESLKQPLISLLLEKIRRAIPNVLTRLQILVVDDESPIRQLLRQELEDAGYDVIEAANGLEAVEMAKQFLPDIIIIDIMMPVLNGFDAATVIKNNPSTKTIPIIVVSIVEDTKRGFGIGIDRYFTKPVDMESLLGEIRNIINEKVLYTKEVFAQEPKQSKRIILVESPLSQHLSKTLINQGFKILLTHNESECLGSIQSEIPDLVIIDKNHTDRHTIVKKIRSEKAYEDIALIVWDHEETLVESLIQ